MAEVEVNRVSKKRQAEFTGPDKDFKRRYTERIAGDDRGAWTGYRLPLPEAPEHMYSKTLSFQMEAYAETLLHPQSPDFVSIEDEAEHLVPTSFYATPLGLSRDLQPPFRGKSWAPGLNSRLQFLPKTPDGIERTRKVTSLDRYATMTVLRKDGSIEEFGARFTLSSTTATITCHHLLRLIEEQNPDVPDNFRMPAPGTRALYYGAAKPLLDRRLRLQEAEAAAAAAATKQAGAGAGAAAGGGRAPPGPAAAAEGEAVQDGGVAPEAADDVETEDPNKGVWSRLPESSAVPYALSSEEPYNIMVGSKHALIRIEIPGPEGGKESARINEARVGFASRPNDTPRIPSIALVYLQGHVIPVALSSTGREAFGGPAAADAIVQKVAHTLRALGASEAQLASLFAPGRRLQYRSKTSASAEPDKRPDSVRTFDADDNTRADFGLREDLDTRPADDPARGPPVPTYLEPHFCRNGSVRRIPPDMRPDGQAPWALHLDLIPGKLEGAPQAESKGKKGMEGAGAAALDVRALARRLPAASKVDVAALIQSDKDKEATEEALSSLGELTTIGSKIVQDLLRQSMVFDPRADGPKVPSIEGHPYMDSSSLRPCYKLEPVAGDPKRGILTVTIYARPRGEYMMMSDLGVMSDLFYFSTRRGEGNDGFGYFTTGGFLCPELWAQGLSTWSEQWTQRMAEAPDEATRLKCAQCRESMDAVIQVLSTPQPLDKADFTVLNALERLAISAEDERPLADQPEGLSVEMRWYQCQSLQWMLDMEALVEGGRGGFRELFWTKIVNPETDKEWFFSPCFGALASRVQPQGAVGGFLTDEMGLGKTVTTLALILANPHPEGTPLAAPPQTPLLTPTAATLVVCPVSIVGQWIDEAKAKLAAKLKICQYYGPKRERDPKKLAAYDIVVTTYQTLAKDYGDAAKAATAAARSKANPLGEVHWRRIIADESHHVKSSKAAQTKAIAALSSPRRWCVTGTPWASDVEDLVGQIDFLNLRPFDEKMLFDELVRSPTRHPGIYHGPKRAVTSFLLTSVMIRHSKQVIQLPPKHIELVPVYLSAEERTNYLRCHAEAAEQYQTLYARGASAVSAQIVSIMALLGPMRRICSGGRLTASDLRVPNLEERMKARAAAAARRREMGGIGATDVAVPDDVECSVCLDVLEHPVVTPCSHWFCRDCITAVIERQAQLQRHRCTCPLCRAPISLRDLKASRTEEETAAEVAQKERGKGKLAPGDLEASSKLRTLLRELQLMRDKDPSAKALVFTQHSATLEWLKGALAEHGFGHRSISGSQTMSQRTKAIEAFQKDPPTTVFLLTMRSGAVGINLTSASHVFLLEPVLNPALEEQAVGRAWRMGQRREVTVKKLFVKGSVEETYLQIVDQRRTTGGDDKRDRDFFHMSQKDRKAMLMAAGSIKTDRENVRIEELNQLFATPQLPQLPAAADGHAE